MSQVKFLSRALFHVEGCVFVDNMYRNVDMVTVNTKKSNLKFRLTLHYCDLIDISRLIFKNDSFSGFLIKL